MAHAAGNHQLAATLEARSAEPPVPIGFEYLLDRFFLLNRTRPAGLSGVVPLSFEQMKAYHDLTGRAVVEWEVEVILSLDAAFREAVQKETK
jgi:hypothetical protein